MKMDYKEKYEQALERARKLYDASEYVCEMDNYATIFPELCESEDERIRKELISFITDRKNWFPKEETKASWITWLEKQGEQKPAWSEEEEQMFNSIIEVLEVTPSARFIPIKREIMIPWLKSLKDRVIPQPKQEWSEEDYNFIKELCGLLASISKDGYVGKYYTVDLVEKLKSLKPQKHWKPSEEQMKRLKSISIGWHPSLDDCRILLSLYNDLLKL